MSTAITDLPSHIQERLVASLAAGALPWPPPPAALQAVVGRHALLDAVAHVLERWHRDGLSAQAAALVIRTASEARAHAPRPDLVWSGPDVPGIHARDTRQVYDELIESAEHTLWLSTYAYFDGPKAFATLARRMSAVPTLQATLLLNIQRKRGDTTKADHLVRTFADRLWGADWPGAARPLVFYDPRALELDGPGGVLHAKTVVADDKVVFVTSANLTEAAMDRNIELGLLMRDPPLAASVTALFRRLIESELLTALPNA